MLFVASFAKQALSFFVFAQTIHLQNVQKNNFDLIYEHQNYRICLSNIDIIITEFSSSHIAYYLNICPIFVFHYTLQF